jgi:hypothetical protein
VHSRCQIFERDGPSKFHDGVIGPRSFTTERVQPGVEERLSVGVAILLVLHERFIEVSFSSYLSLK